MQPDEILITRARLVNPAFERRPGGEIWSDVEAAPAVSYSAAGKM